MTHKEAVNWIINLTADIGKIEHQSLWHYEQALSEIKEMLETQPEPHWIPVSERLPEHERNVLVTDSYGDVDIARLAEIRTGYDTYETMWTDIEAFFIDVAAWMPLPEPWKGDADAD